LYFQNKINKSNQIKSNLDLSTFIELEKTVSRKSQNMLTLPIRQVETGPSLYWYTINIDVVSGNEIINQECLLDTGSFSFAMQDSFSQNGSEKMSLQYHDTGNIILNILKNIHFTYGKNGKYLFSSDVAQGGRDLNFGKPCDAVFGLLPSMNKNLYSCITNSKKYGNGGITRVTFDFKNDLLKLNGVQPKLHRLSIKCNPGTEHVEFLCDKIVIHLNHPRHRHVTVTYKNMKVSLDTGTTYAVTWLNPDHSLIEECRDSQEITGITLVVGGREVSMLLPRTTLYPPCVPYDISTFRPYKLLLGIQALEGLPGFSYGFSKSGTEITDIQIL
jgi:hypothetical protein